MPLKLGLLITLLAIFYQTILHKVLFLQLGIGRTVQRIEDFPFTCRRVFHPLLESCEDLVVDELGRRVYAVCSDKRTRMGWMAGPATPTSTPPPAQKRPHLHPQHRHPRCKRSLQRPPPPHPHSQFPKTYQSASYNQEIDVHAISLYVPPKGDEPVKLRLMINNHRPPIFIDGDGDVAKYGADSRIEVFELRRGSEELEFVRTIWSPEVVFTPNNLWI
ncbi:hypothetical protein HYFRA_00011831 [Hymenoscyphus fraxineus]|uniref:Uncharacterized protein n=1 Tax=Hymenoscyphus fraxineus TaxID=746836 RepID=A0A9N9L685_9HELO|nr:hypothetical protein HYFRA_00011831 [Hymenoscyphus fraxineus]